MKFLVIIILLFFVCALIALRYRQQIQTALYVWRMYKKMRQVNKPPEKQITRPESTKDARLVRCAKCGTWTPQKKALNLRSKSYYCSTQCLENAVRVLD